jgi:hypothetical protein
MPLGYRRSEWTAQFTLQRGFALCTPCPRRHAATLDRHCTAIGTRSQTQSSPPFGVRKLASAALPFWSTEDSLRQCSSLLLEPKQASALHTGTPPSGVRKLAFAAPTPLCAATARSRPLPTGSTRSTLSALRTGTRAPTRCPGPAAAVAAQRQRLYNRAIVDRSSGLIPCIGCGALVPDVNGPTFRYRGAASPGCWAVYGEILARECGEFRDPAIHWLTVDTYAAQHPGTPTPQTIQSVTVHLISLGLVLERGADPARATDMMRRAIARFKGDFTWLEPPASRGGATVLDVVQAGDLAGHVECVDRWADSVWRAWSGHHNVIRRWLDRLESR